MKLEPFHVWNFHSINDSGLIHVSKITALLGRNESGKSNLLLALKSLNPIEGLAPLIKDFPRHRRLEECTHDVKVLSTNWRLTPEEQSELAELFARVKSVEVVEICRSYGSERWMNLSRLQPLQLNTTLAVQPAQ